MLPVAVTEHQEVSDGVCVDSVFFHTNSSQWPGQHSPMTTFHLPGGEKASVPPIETRIESATESNLIVEYFCSRGVVR